MEPVKQFFREYNSDERSESFQRTMRLILTGVAVLVALLVIAALADQV